MTVVVYRWGAAAHVMRRVRLWYEVLGVILEVLLKCREGGIVVFLQTWLLSTSGASG